MKKTVFCSLMTILLLAFMAGPGFTKDRPGHRGPSGMDHSEADMMGMKMKGMQGMPCMMASTSPADHLDKMVCMLTGKMPMKSGKMHSMMKKEFFLDRVEELGLQKTQIQQLKDLQSACRRDNLRTATEVKISRFDLDDLLEGDWTLDAVEQLIRKIAKLEGDMKVRHLAAVKDALAVLTADQLEKLAAGDSPESLFEK
ncbi:hypothetical protein [Geothermobacter hydrogeniphilus]|uniref:LTXXQ motif family protein n=1 Tax=Geothermobacter hydrogeniphilus TaxID=1969733 RepID=A0A1X0Y8U3_9BACT|nr:hypothetical protein [Geothermobacter hydrogeniphilus]ORJ61503.1 hypothetical protein B5V00_05550 [Geothermobacter hydrogeniphilus]